MSQGVSVCTRLGKNVNQRTLTEAFYTITYVVDSETLKSVCVDDFVGTQRSEEPVSKVIRNSCFGVPM